MKMPKKKSREQHLSMIKYLKAMFRNNLTHGRYTFSMKKEEMEGVITACIIAGSVLDAKISLEKYIAALESVARGEAESVLLPR